MKPLSAFLLATALVNPAAAAQVTLRWLDNSDNETGFQIERSSAGWFSVLATVPADTTHYIDTSVSGGTTYTYRVCAYNGFGRSGYSNSATVAVYAPPVMTPPGARAVPANTTVVVPLEIAGGSGTFEFAATASSANPALFPTGSLEVVTTEAGFGLRIAPGHNEVGQAVVTVTVDDGRETAAVSFQVTVAGQPPAAPSAVVAE